MPERDRISVIIPSARSHDVGHTVDALLSAEVLAEEIIVVAQLNPEHDALAGKGVRFVHVPALYPPGKMRNIGARAAQGGLLAFIDDDCIPPPGWLRKLRDVVRKEKNVGVVGCRVVGIKNDFWIRCADYSLFAAYQHMSEKSCSLGSAALIVKKDAFEEINGFDEGLKASEDWDFSLHLAEKGWKCIFTPEVEVFHNHGCNTLKSILSKSYSYGLRSNLVVQRRHLSKMSWLARLSVAMGSPWLYWMLILPYSALVTLFQVCEFFRGDRKVLAYMPVIFGSRCAYHVGVWKSLFQDNYHS